MQCPNCGLTMQCPTVFGRPGYAAYNLHVCTGRAELYGCGTVVQSIVGPPEAVCKAQVLYYGKALRPDAPTVRNTEVRVGTGTRRPRRKKGRHGD